MNWLPLLFFLPFNDGIGQTISIMQPKFISAVQILVRERDPKLAIRSKKLVESAFGNHFAVFPSQAKLKFETAESGSELDFLFFSEEDLNEEIDQLIRLVRKDIEGKVKSRGRALYFQTSLPKINQTYLEILVDDDSKRLTKILAKDVPFLELLQQLPNQVRQVSYSLSGGCSDLRINYSFENKKGKTFEQVMEDMGKKNQFKMVKANGTFYFNREQDENEEVLFGQLPYPTVRVRPRTLEAKTYPINARLDTQEVFLPLPPLLE